MESKNSLRNKSGVFSNFIPGKDGSVSILLYGEIGDKEKVDPTDIVSQLFELSNRYKAISVHINSNGGDVFSGIAIFNALKSSDADISIHVDGVAASIAGVIALCGKKLYMNQYARLMIHNVSGGCFGNKEDLRDMISCIENLENTIADMISKRCQKSKEEISALYFDGKDHWITAQEALSMGLIDGITGDKEDVPENGTVDDIYNYFNNKLMSSKSNSFGLKADVQTAYDKGFISQSDYDYLNRLICVITALAIIQYSADMDTIIALRIAMIWLVCDFTKRYMRKILHSANRPEKNRAPKFDMPNSLNPKISSQ